MGALARVAPRHPGQVQDPDSEAGALLEATGGKTDLDRLLQVLTGAGLNLGTDVSQASEDLAAADLLRLLSRIGWQFLPGPELVAAGAVDHRRRGRRLSLATSATKDRANLLQAIGAHPEQGQQQRRLAYLGSAVERDIAVAPPSREGITHLGREPRPELIIGLIGPRQPSAMQ